MTLSTEPIIERRVLLRDVPWETYEQLLRDLQGQRVFLTYDRGSLEIMSPSPQHEKIGKYISRMVEAFTLERRIPIVGLGNTTWKKPAELRGLEADECYYIAKAEWAKGREEFDLLVDPPPDLAIEVDVTSSSIDKEAIYASLGVPELWRYENERLQYLRLAGGIYLSTPTSVHLPELPRGIVETFARRRGESDDTTMMLEFLNWVKTQSA